MLGISITSLSRPIERVLAIGCHPDDIEIGCGATLLALLRAQPSLHVDWVVLAAPDNRAQEARRSAEAFLSAAGSSDIRLHEFRDGYLPYIGDEVKDVFEGMKELHPDLVFTHTRDDLHQDHRLACELTWNTFRNELILEYEIPKYDGDLGVPNLFVPLDEELVQAKLRLVSQHHRSQLDKHWFDDDLFRGLMRLRGMECASRFAEAFVCRKLSLALV